MSTSGDSQYINDFIMGHDEDGTSCDEEDSDNKQSGSRYLLREQDRFLPICNIIKIMKVPVPHNGKIAKDARECIQECVSEFVSFITSEAIERSIAENRKTVNGDDLVYAFANLGFDNYVEPLSTYLHKFRESTKSDRNLFNNASLQQDESSSDIPTQSNNSRSQPAPPVVNSIATPVYTTVHNVAGVGQELPQSITITPMASATPTTTTPSMMDSNNSSPLRRSARLLTRPPLPVVTTVATDSSGMMGAEQLIFYSAGEFQQHVLKQQQQQQQLLINNTTNNTYLHI